MDDLIIFLSKEKEELMFEELKISKQFDKLTIEYAQIENKIAELIKGVDTVYEIFSPNASDMDYSVAEIKKLKSMLAEHEATLKSLDKKKQNIKKKINDVCNAISEYKRLTSRERELNEDISQKKTENEIELERLRKIAIEISELEERRYARTMSNGILSIIDSLIYKTELCDGIILQDINRGKMELSGIKEGLITIKDKSEDSMFHVKHQVSENTVDLGKMIEKYIQSYQEITISFTQIGNDIQMSYSDIQNNIKIIHELIDNAICHGAATQIQIYLQVENKEELSKLVSITIIDDGCGFHPEEINESSQFGLQIVKKRIELYQGSMEIETNREEGTKIILNYE